MIQLDGDSLVCPHCSGSFGTHLEKVLVTARHEDGPAKHISVQPHTGQIELETEAPVGRIGEGRRDRTSLIFHCENGCDFSVVFTQHKGETFVEAVPAEPAAQHSITVKPYSCGNAAADAWDPEHEWFCTCGDSGIVSGRFAHKAQIAGQRHLTEAHGQSDS